MKTAGSAVHRLRFHRGAALRRVTPWALGAWALAIVCALFYALAVPGGPDIGLVLGVGLGFALVVTIALALWVRSRPSNLSARWAGAPGASALEVVDAAGRVRATLPDVREAGLVRWTLRSRLGSTQGLALVYPGAGEALALGALGARTADGARVSGNEPIGEPCAWLVPGALWAEIERAVRERAGEAEPPKRRGAGRR